MGRFEFTLTAISSAGHAESGPFTIEVAPADAESTPTATPTVTAPTTAPTSPPAAVPTADVAAQLTVIAKRLVVKGRPKVGKNVIVANLEATLRTAVAYKFQWYAGKNRIKKATKPRLKIARTLKGKKLSVRVTITADGVTKKVVLKVGKVR